MSCARLWFEDHQTPAANSAWIIRGGERGAGGDGDDSSLDAQRPQFRRLLARPIPHERTGHRLQHGVASRRRPRDVKHFIGNESEYPRTTMRANTDERTLW